MLFQKLTLMLIVVFSTTVYAEEKQPIDLDDPKPLIMQPGYNLDSEFSEKSTPDVFTIPETSGPSVTPEESLNKFCAELLSAADKLVGRPQQRWAAMERYKHECQNAYDRSPE